ncbi:MAG: DNA primase [Alphaproteobacteria bacterium]|nr:DNA primase [Alphaproteobacteria bacterium]
MSLPPSFLDELRARLPLAALVGRHVRLTRRGKELTGLCPFHNEKSPSFTVNEAKGFFHCFGCGAHGDAIGFVMRRENLPFMEAVEKLAAEAGLAMPRRDPGAAAAEERRTGLTGVMDQVAADYERRLRLPEGKPALDYLHRRGLSEETIRRFRLGWSGEGRGALLSSLGRAGVTVEQLVAGGLMKPANSGEGFSDLFFSRVMFPIRDRRGRVIGFGGRILGDGQPKYVNSPETELFHKRRSLYGLDLAAEPARKAGRIIVVEGYMDVIALHQAGFPQAVAPLGTALTEEQMAELWRYAPEPLLCFDGDAAGARAAARAAELALPLIEPGRSLRFVTLPAREDPDTLIRRAGPAAFTALLERARGLAETLFGLIAEGGGGAATPEQRAALRQRLDQAAGTIKDPALRDEYRYQFRTWWEERFRPARRFGPGERFQGGGPRGQGRASGAGARYGSSAFHRPGYGGPGNGLRGRIAVTTPTPARAAAERERCLVAILLNHPALIAQVEETLAGLDFADPALDSLRRALLDIAHSSTGSGTGLDAAHLARHLLAMGLRETAEAVLSPVPTPLPACAMPSAMPADAWAGWWHFSALGRRERLNEEIAEAEAALAREFSAANEQRLVALRRVRAALDEDEAGAQPPL